MRPLLAVLLLGAGIATAQLAFREHTVATGLKGGYQVVAADLNHDGKPDLIALASGMKELVWFENPGWERHVIAEDQSRMINLAYWNDTIVLAKEFSNRAKESLGIVSVLTPAGDPRKPWSTREIDRLPASHRLRWAAIDGRKVAVNAPLTAANAEPPEYRGHVPLVFYRPGEWKRESIGTENEGVMHGIYVTDWRGDGRDAILTASFSGIALYEYRTGRWTRTELAKGDPAPCPKCGSSDVAVGVRGAKRERFLTAIEPWHGNQAAVYREAGGQWQREVIEDTLNDGHTIQTADLDGDGQDEIIAGFRGKPQSVYLYRWDGAKWVRSTLDGGGIAAAACVVADLNGDGAPDVACIGSATQNLKWYENLRGRR